ncbi:MAG: hypothetical protein IAF38_09445 [Bacteroidia bacterium]|nr:hypothetical protein [Bacteroidia bacterium]
MKKIILLFVPFLLLVSSLSANGGSDFEKRKYRKGNFTESIKKITVPVANKIQDTYKKISSKITDRKTDAKSSGASDVGEFLIVYLLLATLLSLILAAIWVTVATAPISFGAAFLSCLVAILGGCCCCSGHHHHHW